LDTHEHVYYHAANIEPIHLVKAIQSNFMMQWNFTKSQFWFILWAKSCSL